MLQYILRRIVWLVPVLIIVLLIVFLLMHAVAGSPWDNSNGIPRAMANVGMDETTLKTLRQRYGLDQPLWMQFGKYLIGQKEKDGRFVCGLICGNMGPSIRQAGQTVQEILFEAPKNGTVFESRFFYTLRLSMYAFALALAIGLPLGILAAVRYGTWIDYAIKSFATLLISLPNFVVGLVIIIVLAGNLNIITVAPSSWKVFDLRVWGAPILILSIGAMASFIRLTRSSLLDVITKDYVRTARGKGAHERRIIWLHVLKNALIPLITFSGPALMELFAGSFVVETMYGYPGMGRLFINSVVNLDYFLILGVALVYALMVVLANLTVDLLYGWVDPRIRVEG
jgi:oligopeptide transport system permease protein